MREISVVVPVYNKVKNLEVSLDSLLANRNGDIEFLLIDDKSTDGSLDILKDYAKKDERIRLLENVENCGVSYTRNKGMKEATGEYIGFFDADDTVDYGFYQSLYQKAMTKRKKPEIVIGNFQIKNGKYDYSSRSTERLKPFIPFSLQRASFINREVISCCNKIYHHEFIEDKSFPDYIKEDCYFYMWTMREAKRVEENMKLSYYYHLDHSERNVDYFLEPNGKFVELIEGHNWTIQKIGDSKKLRSAFGLLETFSYIDLLRGCIDWNIPPQEKKELVTTIIDFCIETYPDIDKTIFGRDVLTFYDSEVRNQNQKVKSLEQKVRMLGSIYKKY